MKRRFRSFPIKNCRQTKLQMLNWANRFNICCFLDDHQYHLPVHSQECLMGVGSRGIISAQAGLALVQFQQFVEKAEDWCFGHLGYDLKNEIEPLHSRHPDHIQFPDLTFFVPEVVLMLNQHELAIGLLTENHPEVYESICQSSDKETGSSSPVNVRERITRNEYLQTIRDLQNHIVRGDCYEINFCQEFYAEHARINPIQVYLRLSDLSPNPFSAYYRLEDKYLLCASPERYLKKEGSKIISQPIKGTSRRNLEDKMQDENNRQRLSDSQKDRAENVMVVDMVRNDLARVCREGTVKVDELFGIYSFPQVHQMISTISGELREGIGLADLIRASFPMGSMTGAPKRSVMELIEKFEKTKRGLFSGAVGYISPEQDADFNVVIRSIQYNSSSSYLSFQTGSGITHYSDPEQEYEECLLKASAMKKVLESSLALPGM